MAVPAMVFVTCIVGFFKCTVLYIYNTFNIFLKVQKHFTILYPHALTFLLVSKI